MALSLLLPLLLATTGCEDKKEAAAPALPTVLYMEVAEEPATLTRELPGRISAFRVSEVRPQVGGIIQARFFEEGTDVEAGQVLYQIDPALYQAAYNNAKANLGRALANEEAARLLAERYARLAKTNAVSVQERDDALAAYNQNIAEIEAYRQALETAAINLGYTKITAPVSGRIGHSFVTEGALVTQNQAQPLAKIQQISPVYVDVTQSSSQLLHLKQALASGALKNSDAHAARVRLQLENGAPYKRSGPHSGPHSDSGDWIEGALLFSDISVDESTGAVILRAKFDNPDGLLLPGMYARATLVEGVAERAILVPQRAVFRDARNRPQVYVLHPVNANDGSARAGSYTVETRSVIIDREHQGRWLLSSGLAHGELLLVEGLLKVRPGQTVSGKPVAAGTAPDKPATEAVTPAAASREGG